MSVVFLLSRKPTNRLLGSELLPSLPRTARVPPERSGPVNIPHSVGKFLDVEAAASDTDSSGDCLEETNADVNKHELDSVVVADDIGDGSSIEWSASPPRVQVDIERSPSPRVDASQSQDESADDTPKFWLDVYAVNCDIFAYRFVSRGL
ncbi:hypothetical protein C8J55DRAFT_559334 [Lentinula edodes]|uniref:Uncharacterized protein n=1 Tax=Lentinula lateritia TaxID=40482 RepID=A0A9W9AMJ4_9AGAR|nr:hypothetical protein C8J55DRAFT_559334 [Lentinula edodes]